MLTAYDRIKIKNCDIMYYYNNVTNIARCTYKTKHKSYYGSRQKSAIIWLVHKVHKPKAVRCYTLTAITVLYAR